MAKDIQTKPSTGPNETRGYSSAPPPKPSQNNTSSNSGTTQTPSTNAGSTPKK